MQNSFLNFVIFAGRTSLKFLFITFLGFPGSDKFFTTRSSSPLVLIKLFFNILIKNFSKILIRLMLVVLVLKVSATYFMNNYNQFIPSFKEIILFPIIIFRLVFITAYKFIFNQMLGDQ